MQKNSVVKLFRFQSIPHLSNNCYIPETGTDLILLITNPATENCLAISPITWVEVLSAMSRRYREESLSLE
jgi:hypothetical protein